MECASLSAHDVQKQAPVNAGTLQKAIQTALAPLCTKIEALIQALEADDEATEDEEDDQPLQAKPGRK